MTSYFWNFDDEFSASPRMMQIHCEILQKKMNPKHAILEKDINDMVLNGVAVEEIISNNVFHNLEAELRFTNWRKC